MKILIVDDSKEMRNIISEFLNTGGSHEIFELEDGIDAIEQYPNINPDWVLMDIKMKKMNGLDAAKKIKQKCPDSRIAIVSRYDDKFFRTFAAKVGAEAFISKQNLMEFMNLLG